jgi:hypothetical protein
MQGAVSGWRRTWTSFVPQTNLQGLDAEVHTTHVGMLDFNSAISQRC